MRRGWEVELDDGTILQEVSYQWKDVPKSRIKSLALLYDGRRWDIIGKEHYFIRNTASMVPGDNRSIRVERRSIGYYDGSSKVIYSVDEFTGRFNIKIEE